jgi:tetratricopeptide (TPR) repeat protein
MGLAVSGPATDTQLVMDFVRQSAVDAIKAGDLDKAVKWARAGMALGGDDDLDAHALLADVLYASKGYQESVAEYQKALAGRPDDASLKRGLDRARKKLGAAAKPVRARAKARTANAASDDGSTEGAADDDSSKSAPAPSAPPEPASDEQK